MGTEIDLFRLLNLLSTDDIVQRTSLISKSLEADQHYHPPLIKLMSIAATPNLEILPLKWRPALEPLGEGATRSIGQFPMNRKLSFAFKRFINFSDDHSDQTPDERQILRYNAVLAEIMILSHPEIYHHPNIVNLEGLCWEIVGKSSEIQPVLVFRKADAGNLRTFLALTESEDLSFEDLVDISGEVAKGMRILHLCGVVHGDLKPDNVLAFHSPELEAYGIKITDFGFSCFGVEDDLVQLPLSVPWQAPEYSGRPVLVKAAKRMDVYSFGLLVLWLLFKDETFTCRNGSVVSIDDAFRGQNKSAQKSLQIYKQSGNILKLALNKLSQKAEVDDHLRHRVQAVFQMAPEHDPSKRAADMQPFLKLLCKDDSLDPTDLATNYGVVDLPDWHGKIDITAFFFERWRNLLVAQSALKMLLSRSLCVTILVLVLKHGDQQRCWLNRSGGDPRNFEKLVQNIKETDPPVAVMRQISDLGYQSNMGSEYYQEGLLEQALWRHEEMAKARALAPGRSHFSARRMYAVLADLLAYNHQLAEAAVIFEQELRITELLQGSERDSSEVLVQSKLARIYIREGKLNRAELLLGDVLNHFGKGEEHGMAYRLPALCDMCDLVLRTGDHNRAINMAVAAAEESRQFLGPFHETTWRIEGIQVDAYMKAGEAQEALKIVEKVISEKQQAFGREDPDTITWMQRRGPIYVELKDWEKARDCFEEVEKSLNRSNVSTALQRLVARSNYMGALARTGQAERATEALQDVISQLERILPPNHLHILGSKNNLAIAFQSQGLHEAAEPLQRDVVERFRSQLPHGDDRVLRALGNLSDTSYNLKKWPDTALFSSEELEARQSRQMEVSEELVRAIQKAGRSNAHLKRWNEAATQLAQELEWRKTLGSIDTIDGLDAIGLLAVTYLHLEDWDHARQRVGELFERFLEVQNARKSFLDTIYELGELCETHQMLAEAEELLKLAVLIRHVLLPDSKNTTQESSDEARTLDLMCRQGKVTDEIRFDPSDIIERARRLL